jgi:hypothetical protein
MLTLAEAQRRTEDFLTGQMLDALRAVEYELPSFDTEPVELALGEAARGRVEFRHVRGAADATYLVQAFGDELLMQLQLNIYRLVVVYRVPARDALDASSLAVHLERWRLGAEHAGWKFGWRDAPTNAKRFCARKSRIASIASSRGNTFEIAKKHTCRIVFMWLPIPLSRATW